ncbi:sunset domain-containing protein [Arthrobacter sp. SAFR-179]|uniref:sunset domain-containing protein n=1 Tax=Arthrobacter sp. SAFR-179 TaxID=3387279 RepID=UPI003F7BEE23
MDIVFWIILIVVIAVIIWWLLNRSKSAGPSGRPSAGTRTDGALEGGSAAASADAAGTTGIPTAAGFGKPAEPAVPAAAEEPADSSASGSGTSRSSVSGGSASASGAEAGQRHHQDQSESQSQNEAADQAEWETQWSEAGAGSGSSAVGSAGTPAHQADRTEASAGTASGQASPPDSRPVHHDEYTAPHAPTLPGAETAAIESADDAGPSPEVPAGGHPSQHRADSSESVHRQPPAAPAAAGGSQGEAAAAETLDRTQSSALVENGADHHQPSGQGQDVAAAGPAVQAQGPDSALPSGHLAADEPYGAGSAAPGPDGSGPADYTVKGDAAAMVYYEEGHPDYEQTRAEVWFESAAHAEAAGFRAPRRKRL